LSTFPGEFQAKASPLLEAGGFAIRARKPCGVFVAFQISGSRKMNGK
jgi:hypothetical protein